VARRGRRVRLPSATLNPSGPLATSLVGERITAIDVGAAGGPSAHWLPYLSVMEVDCFEPDAKECRRLQATAPPNIHWFPVALAGTSGRRPFFVLKRATGSSLYPPNEAILTSFSGDSYAGIREVIEVDCLSLNDFLATHERPSPNLIKLDTQGSELEILSSLDDHELGALLFVEVEVEFLELYRGQPLFTDVDAFMTRNDFRLLDLRTHRSYRNTEDQPYHYLRKHLNTASGSPRISAELVAGDALYVHAQQWESAAIEVATLMKYLLLCKMYRFYDLAFWLIDVARRNHRLTEGESAALAADVSWGAPRPHLRERADLAGALTRRMLWVLGRDDHEVFWTRREWPDQ
jgi:FkbM family methyltransferase